MFIYVNCKFEYLNNILCNKCFCSILSRGRDPLSWPLVLTFIWCSWRGTDTMLFSKGVGRARFLPQASATAGEDRPWQFFEPSTKLTGFETWPHTLKPTPRWHVLACPSESVFPVWCIAIMWKWHRLRTRGLSDWLWVWWGLQGCLDP